MNVNDSAKKANAEKMVVTDGSANTVEVDKDENSTHAAKDVMTDGAASSAEAGDAAACNLWQYWSKSQKKWFDMDTRYCILHDKVVDQGHTDVDYVYARMNGKFYHYEEDLVAMTQTNCHTGTVRPLRRLVESSPY